MKQHFISVITMVSISIFFLACNNSSETKKTASDTSITIRDSVIKPNLHQAFEFNQANTNPEPIPRERESQYEDEYKKHPALVDAHGSPILGFMLDTASDANKYKIDFKELMNTKGIDNIYVKLGVNGTYTDSATSEIKNTYTIMIIPVDKDQKPIATKRTYQGKEIFTSAYDVVCPCVNGQGCCPR